MHRTSYSGILGLPRCLPPGGLLPCSSQNAFRQQPLPALERCRPLLERIGAICWVDAKGRRSTPAAQRLRLAIVAEHDDR